MIIIKDIFVAEIHDKVVAFPNKEVEPNSAFVCVTWKGGKV